MNSKTLAAPRRPLWGLIRPRSLLLWAAHALAWAVGIVLGFGFGWRVSGTGLGVVTGLLSGLCLSLLMDAATQGAERLAVLWDRRRAG